MPRHGHCGRYPRTAETTARQREKANAFWSDPEARLRHSKLVTARMRQPGVSEHISQRTREALAAKPREGQP
jgi:hypothetical protein